MTNDNNYSLKNMECPCGAGKTKTETHTADTLIDAREWYPLVKAELLPIEIEHEKCESCGFEAYNVFSDSRLMYGRSGKLDQ